MSRNQKLFLFGLLVIGLLTRLRPYLIAYFSDGTTVHSTLLPWNLSPMTGILLFTGAVYATRYAFMVPLSILLVSDFGIYFLTGKIEYTCFGGSAGLLITYLTMILIALCGTQFLRKYNFFKIIGAGIAAEVIFFLVSNSATWWFGTTYSHTPSGWVTCLYAGIPFAGRSLLSTLIYAPAIFYAYHYFCLGETTLSTQQKTVEA